MKGAAYSKAIAARECHRAVKETDLEPERHPPFPKRPRGCSLAELQIERLS